MSDIAIADGSTPVSLGSIPWIRTGNPMTQLTSVVDLTLNSAIWRTIHAAYGLSVWLLGLVRAQKGSLDE